MPIQDMLASKKFIAACLASVLALIGTMYGLDPSAIAMIIAPLGGYTVAQGIADIGKEKAKVEVINGENQK